MASGSLSASSTLALRPHGSAMPVVGFGVYQSRAAYDSVTAALHAGYTHIDSARVYRNEVEVGRAVRDFLDSDAGRGKKVFLTTKIQGKEHGREKATNALKESIARLAAFQLKWDLVLLHDPTSGPERRIEAYMVLEEAVARGEIVAAGVSNWSDRHLRELKAAGALTVPSVNQIELHPWCQQRPIVAYCGEEGIVVQAYCPLVRGTQLHHQTVLAISRRLGKDPANVLLRWSLQKGYVPLPKSDTPSRIKSNFAVYDFELDDKAMQELDSLDKGAEGACSWNVVGFSP